MTPLFPHRAARSRPSAAVPSSPGRRPLLLAAVLGGLMLLGSFTFLFTDGHVLGPPASLPPNAFSGGVSPTGSALRDPALWPFSRDSIWNLPIGANANYVLAKIPKPSAYGMTTDVDVLILTPTAPVTSVYYNGDAWGGGSRCNAQGGVLFSAPIPTNFVVPGAGSGNPDGTTPNYATAILMADGHTLEQGQPMARCTPGGTATMMWSQQNEDLFGTGNSGAHGGSMLSSLGGTIRLGELVPGGTVRHVMKVNLYGAQNYWYDGATHGYRWPATTSDSCASGCYHGSVPALRMGSLLALPGSVDIASMSLETEPAKILAHAFQDYGAYTVDDAAWSVYAVSTEYSPSGKIEDEFQAAWGFQINPASRDVPWSRDMDRIFGALAVVDNWDAGAWATVSPSNGTLGAGLGAPRVAWAPEFGSPVPGPGPDTIPPVSSVSLSGASGAANWFVSPVQVTLSATDAGSGVASIYIRTDGTAWQTYQSPVTIQGDGSHSIEYYATDVAGNTESVHTSAAKIDALPPATTSATVGTLLPDGSYADPVTITLTATDATSGVASTQFRIDGGAWRSYTAPFLAVGNGTHVFEYFATDAAGNVEATSTRSFRITGGVHMLPVTVISPRGTAGANGWFVSRVDVTLIATGTPTSIAYRVDGGTWATYAGPFSLAEGRHVLEFQASEGTGYLEPLKSSTIDIDYTPPAVADMTRGGDLRPDEPVSWAGSDATSGIVRYEVGIDGASPKSVGLATSLSRSWTVGTHVVVVRAFDTAGNSAERTINFHVAATAPQPPQSPPFPQGTSAVAPLVVFLTLAAAAVWYCFRGGKGRSVARRGKHPKGARNTSKPRRAVDSTEPVKVPRTVWQMVGLIPGAVEDRIAVAPPVHQGPSPTTDSSTWRAAPTRRNDRRATLGRELAHSMGIDQELREHRF